MSEDIKVLLDYYRDNFYAFSNYSSVEHLTYRELEAGSTSGVINRQSTMFDEAIEILRLSKQYDLMTISSVIDAVSSPCKNWMDNDFDFDEWYEKAKNYRPFLEYIPNLCNHLEIEKVLVNVEERDYWKDKFLEIQENSELKSICHNISELKSSIEVSSNYKGFFVSAFVSGSLSRTELNILSDMITLFRKLDISLLSNGAKSQGLLDFCLSKKFSSTNLLCIISTAVVALGYSAHKKPLIHKSLLCGLDFNILPLWIKEEATLLI